MQQLLLHMQLIIGKKSRKLKQLDGESLEHAILECEIEDAIRVVSIVNDESTSEADKVHALNGIYMTTTSHSIHDALLPIVETKKDSVKIRTLINLSSYTDFAVDLFIEQAVGKPFKDSEDEEIGKIVEVHRTDDKKVVELVVEIFMEGGESLES